MPNTSIELRVRQLLSTEHFDDQARTRLRELGDEALPELRRWATGSDRGEAAVRKARAILALGDQPGDAALDTLEVVAADRRLDNRLRAVTALGSQGTPRAVEILERCARRDDAVGVEVATVARSLAGIGGGEAAAALERVQGGISAPEIRRQVEIALDRRDEG